MSEATRLRELAQWWREFAEVGYSRKRQERIAWAEHLERLAGEHEKREKEQKS